MITPHSTLRRKDSLCALAGWFMVSTISCHTPTQSPSSHSCQKPALCKVRIVFSKPVHAVRALPVPTMAFSKPPAQSPSSLSYQKPALCKVRVVFSKPVHAVRAAGGPFPVPTMAFSNPSRAATMCTAPCGKLHPPPPVPPFLLTLLHAR